MAYTTDDLAAIDAAIASGELTVKTNDRLVTYRSIDELLRARNHIAAVLASQDSSARLFPRFQTPDFSDD